MAQRLVMLIDSRRCVDCKACQLACKTEHNLPEGHWRNWIHGEITPDAPKVRAVFQPGACLHCNEPTCVRSCPTGATFRHAATGEVRIDRRACIGCGACVPACPYGARAVRRDTGVADKCDFCASRRAQGLEPACVSTCPTGVRLFGDANNAQSDVARALGSGTWVALEAPNAPSKPNLLYAESAKPDGWLRPPEDNAAMGLLSRVVAPMVRVIVGAAALGLGAAVARQLILPDAPEARDKTPQGDAHD